MARYDADHKERTRARILETAGRRLKSDGIDGAGVATLMKDAGLTNGAFYAHFASKDDLVSQVVEGQLGDQRGSLARLVEERGVEAAIRSYLTWAHRQDVAGGCPSAALLDEVARATPAVRDAYTRGLLGVVDDLLEALPAVDGGPVSRGVVLSAVAQMFGALQLARALTDEEVARTLLHDAADAVVATLSGPSRRP